MLGDHVLNDPDLVDFGGLEPVRLGARVGNAWELPHASPPLPSGDLANTKTVVMDGNPAEVGKFYGLFFLAADGKLILNALPMGFALLDEGARTAEGGSRFAHRGAKLHEGLVPIAGAFVRCHALCPCPGGFFELRTGIAASGQSGKHPFYVAIDQGSGLIESDRGDGSGGVGTDAGNFAPFFGGLGPIVLLGDKARAFEKEATAAIVAETLPLGKYILIVSFGEGLDGGEASEPAMIVGNHGGDLRLLEHDLANPDRIRIVGVSPRKVALFVVIPCEKRTVHFLYIVHETKQEDESEDPSC